MCKTGKMCFDIIFRNETVAKIHFALISEFFDTKFKKKNCLFICYLNTTIKILAFYINRRASVYLLQKFHIYIIIFNIYPFLEVLSLILTLFQITFETNLFLLESTSLIHKDIAKKSFSIPFSSIYFFFKHSRCLS